MATAPPRLARALGPRPSVSAAPASLADRLSGLLALAVVAVPFLVIGVNAMRGADEQMFLAADFGLIELATREASRFQRLLGPWSRFGWNHPGPAYFYALAPVYILSGSQGAGLYASALTINAAAGIAIVATAARGAGYRGALAASAVVAAFVAAAGPVALRDVWNPAIVALPMLALVVLCAAAAAGSFGALAGAALLASFLVQTHVGTAPLAVIALVAGAASWGSALRRQTAPHPEPVAGVLLAAGLAVLWLPPLVEQLTAPSGNATELVGFLLGGNEPHGLAESARAVAVAATTVPFGPPAQDLSDALGPGRSAVLLLYAALAGTCVRSGDHNRFVAALGWATLAGASVSVAAATRVAGPLLGYLVYWTAAVPLAGAIGAAVLLATRTTRVALLGMGLLAVALSVTACLAVRGAAPLSDLSDDRVAAIVDAADKRGLLADPVLVSLASSGRGEWIMMAGVVNELDRRGVDVRVPDPWVARYGPRQGTTGAEPVELVLGKVGEALDPAVTRGTRPLVTAGDAAALYRRR